MFILRFAELPEATVRRFFLGSSNLEVGAMILYSGMRFIGVRKATVHAR